MAFLPSVDVIVFDLDNTLIDRQRAFTRWLSEFFRAQLPDITPIDRRERLRHLLRLDDGGRASRHLVCGEIAREIGGAMSPTEIGRQLLDELYLHVERNDRVVKFLEQVASEKQIALATNGSSVNQKRKLTAATLIEAPWQYVAISQLLGVSKPHHEFFELVQRRLRRPPERLLMVGDDWDRDIQGAAAAGWQTCWVSWGRRLPDHGTAPDLVLQDVFELTRALEACGPVEDDTEPAMVLDSEQCSTRGV